MIDPTNIPIGSRGELSARQGRREVDPEGGGRFPRSISRKLNHLDLDEVVEVCERANSAPCGLRNCKVGRPRELGDIEDSPPDPQCPTWSPMLKMARIAEEPPVQVDLLRSSIDDEAPYSPPLPEVQLELDFFEEMELHTDFGLPLEDEELRSASSYNAKEESEDMDEKEWWTKGEVITYVEKAMEEVTLRMELQLGGTLNSLKNEVATLKSEVAALTGLVSKMKNVMKQDADIIEALVRHTGIYQKPGPVSRQRSHFASSPPYPRPQQPLLLPLERVPTTHQDHPPADSHPAHSALTAPPQSAPTEVPPVEFEVDGVSVAMTPPKEISWGTAPALSLVPHPIVEEEVHIRSFHTDTSRHHSPPPKHSTPVAIAATNPLIFALQQNIERPFLDPKEPEGFSKFARQWGEWSKYQLYGAPGGLEGDMMKRDLLLTRVHGAIRDRFAEEIARRPNITFQEVWDSLANQYTVDNPHYWQAKWEGVKLKTTGDHITLADWLLFRTRFETALAKVQDFTETGVVETLLKQLPKSWVEKVLAYEGKEAKKRWMVKMENVPVDGKTMTKVLEKALGPIKAIDALKGVMLVELNSEKQHRALLASPHIAIQGRKIGVMSVRAKLKAHDIFEWVARELREKEESATLCRNFHPSTKSEEGSKPSYVRETTSTPGKRPYPSCATCYKAGRPSDHYWGTCKFASPGRPQLPQGGKGDSPTKKQDVPPVSPPSGKSKGKGKGKGKGGDDGKKGGRGKGGQA